MKVAARHICLFGLLTAASAAYTGVATLIAPERPIFEAVKQMTFGLLGKITGNKEEYLEGLAAFKAGNYAESIVRFSRLADGPFVSDEGRSTALLHRGNAFYKLEQFDAAMADYSAMIPLGRDLGAALHGIGLVQLRKNKFQEALATLDEARRMNHADPRLNFNLGFVLSKLGQHERALAEYSAGLEKDKRDPDAFLGRGSEFARLGRYQDAIADYTTAIELDGNRAKALLGRATARFALKEFDLAVQDYTGAIERDRKLILAYRGRGMAYEALRQPSSAVADYLTVQRLDPTDVWTAVRLLLLSKRPVPTRPAPTRPGSEL